MEQYKKKDKEEIKKKPWIGCKNNRKQDMNTMIGNMNDMKQNRINSIEENIEKLEGILEKFQKWIQELNGKQNLRNKKEIKEEMIGKICQVEKYIEKKIDLLKEEVKVRLNEQGTKKILNVLENK